MIRFKKAVILGATGPTGFHLVPRLSERVPHVRVVSRSEANLRRTFSGGDVDIVAADAMDPDDTRRAIDGCDLVYDCIGLPGDLIDRHPVTARHIADAVRQTGARCIQVSSYWAYLPIANLPLTEDHPRTDGPAWARYRREAEDILQDAGASVLHLPDFYGPRVHTSTLQNALVDAARGRRMNWIGGADVEHEFIYVPDAMQIAAEIASQERAYGERFVLPGAGRVTGTEVAALASGKLRAASPWLLRIVSLFDENLRSFIPMVPHYARTITYDASKLRGLLGDVHVTSYRDGIRETLAWLRDQSK